MAYLIFNSKGRELGRRLLQGPLVIGRAPECDVCVHDILLSRRHCRVEPRGNGWRVVDLSSRNGTHLEGRCIERATLFDGAAIRVGKATITFRSGAFAPAGRDKPQGPRRPADPWEAMSATVSGLEYVKSRALETAKLAPKTQNTSPIGSVSRFPTPQPSPPDPDAYSREDIYSMLTEITSSSWDSIYFNASRSTPRRPAPKPMVLAARSPRQRNAAHVHDSLQANPGLDARGLLAHPPSARRTPRRWRRAWNWMARGFTAAGQMILLTGFLGLFR